METERKISLTFWMAFAISKRCSIGAAKVKPFFCLNVLLKRNGSYLILKIWVLYDGTGDCKYLNSTAVHFFNKLKSVMPN